MFSDSEFELEFPQDNPTVLIGANGSGKTLLTSALQLALGPSDGATELRADLLSAGIERIEADFDCGPLSGKVQVLLQTGQRELRWYAPDAATNGHGLNEPARQARTNGTWEDLFCTDCGAGVFACLNFVCGGELELRFNDELLQSLREEALAPTLRELQGWTIRLHELSGDQDEGGKLAQARYQLQVVEEQIRHVEDVQHKLEESRRSEAELQARLEQLASQHQVVKAELEEWMKLATLADRARRVHAWLDEIQREYAEVAWLREQHGKYQERLDELENIFRGAPDHLDQVLDAYDSAKDRENAIVDTLRELRAQNAQLDESIATLRAELETCILQAADVPPAGQEKVHASIEQLESELQEILRGRVDLVRQREGLQQQLRRDYALFVDLDESARGKLEEYFVWAEQAAEHASERQRSHADARRRRDERLHELRLELEMNFAGFEDLPNKAPEALRELFDRRKLAVTLQSDKEELERKRAVLENRDRESRKHLWTIGAGLLGAVLGAIFGGWDVALFFGLAASGLMMLAGKLIYGETERQLEATLQTIAEVDARRQESQDIAERLQAGFGLLGQHALFDEALEKLNRYRQICREVEFLSTPEPFDAGQETEDTARERDEFARHLPSRLLALPAETAERQYADFLDTERALRALDRNWSAYEDGGTVPLAVRDLESRIDRMRNDLERAATAAARELRNNETRQRELREKIAALETARNAAPSVAQAEADLAQTRRQVDSLLTESAGFLVKMEGDELTGQVRLLRELRTEIRTVRDSLSARQSLDELRARESLLAEELEEVKRKLTALDPLYLLDGTVADYAAKYSRHLESAGEGLTATEGALETVRKSLEAVDVRRWASEIAACETLESLSEREQAAREQVQAVERDVLVAREAVFQLQSEYDEQHRTHRSGLMAAMSQRLISLTDGRCAGVHYAAGRLSAGLPDGSTRPFATLSAGMRDLVWMSIRLTLLDQPSGSPLTPLIWDEPFSRLDDHFLERMQVELRNLARARQIMILSRDRRMAEWGATTELPDLAVASALARL